jgi:uncharacterized protein
MRISNEVRYGSEMKLTDETQRGINFIRAYAPGEVRIGEDVVRTNCIVTADRVQQWSPQSAAAITLADLQPVLDIAPEIIVLGTGETQQFPDAALMGAILSRGIGCEVMTTGAACRTYNVLVSEDRKVAAALML